MENLRDLKHLLNDESALKEFTQIKRDNKEKLWWWVKHNCGVELNLDSMFDIQVKRIHEYKRQLMNTLYCVYRYLEILKTPPEERKSKWVPRSVMIGGKSAPGYFTAKNMIKLINAIGDRINNDSAVGDLFKVVFLPNYNVSLAEIIIPASDISQHISTAGFEASGTSNMKFVMNGSIIIGTMDGANVEIAEEVGEDNIFIFGARINEVNDLRAKMYQSSPDQYMPQPLKEVLGAIRNGIFGDLSEGHQLINTFCNNNDYYLLGADFLSYIEAQNRVDSTWKNKTQWARMALSNSLFSGKFSSDRTIKEYSEEIW